MKIPGTFGVSVFLVIFFVLVPQMKICAQDGKQNDESYLLNNFFNDLYNCSFSKTDSLIVEMSKSNVDEATISNIKANLAWWKILSGEDIEKNIKSCNSDIDESIRLTSDKSDINSLLNSIYSYSLKSRLENHNGNSIKSFIYFYKSISLIEKCRSESGQDEKLKLALGLYYYSIYYIKNEHSVLRPFFFQFPDGNKALGLAYLTECSASDNEMVRTEANYFLFKIYTYTEKDYFNAFKYIQFLTQQYPKNLIYSLEQLKLLLLMKKPYEANILKDEINEEIKYADYLNNPQKIHFLNQIREITKNQN